MMAQVVQMMICEAGKPDARMHGFWPTEWAHESQEGVGARPADGARVPLLAGVVNDAVWQGLLHQPGAIACARRHSFSAATQCRPHHACCN